MDSLNMYSVKQTHSTHNWNTKPEWIVILFHSTTLYHAFTQHQGTEWRRKYFNILSSSSSESFWRSWPSPDSWVKFSILSLPFWYFCCLGLMRSILHNKTPAATPRTHSPGLISASPQSSGVFPLRRDPPSLLFPFRMLFFIWFLNYSSCVAFYLEPFSTPSEILARKAALRTKLIIKAY